MMATQLLTTLRTRTVVSTAKSCRAFMALSLTALLSACGEAPPPPKGQFPLSIEQAFDRLQSKLPDFVRDRQCGILIHVSTDVQKNRHVIWHVKSSGKLMLSFKATLTSVDANTTHVDIAVSPGENGSGEAYDGTQFYKRPAVLQPVRPAIEEQIAALLEGRPYEMSRGKIVHKNGTFSSSPGKDTVCLVQRGGLQSGHVFSIHD
jgi:hypothetical protein